MHQKFTKMEHANKIGFLVGPNVQCINVECYENMTKGTTKGNVDGFELSTSFLYEQGKKSKYIEKMQCYRKKK